MRLHAGIVTVTFRIKVALVTKLSWFRTTQTPWETLEPYNKRPLEWGAVTTALRIMHWQAEELHNGRLGPPIPIDRPPKRTTRPRIKTLNHDGSTWALNHKLQVTFRTAYGYLSETFRLQRVSHFWFPLGTWWGVGRRIPVSLTGIPVMHKLGGELGSLTFNDTSRANWRVTSVVTNTMCDISIFAFEKSFENLSDAYGMQVKP
jgi:hypothetical protein